MNQSSLKEDFGLVQTLHNNDSSVVLRLTNEDYSLQIEDGLMTLVRWGASYTLEVELSISNLKELLTEYGFEVTKELDDTIELTYHNGNVLSIGTVRLEDFNLEEDVILYLLEDGTTLVISY